MGGLTDYSEELVPRPLAGSQDDFVRKQLKNPDLNNNAQTLENAIASACEQSAKAIRDHAVAQYSAEMERLNLIINRGQALLAFTALFGVLVSIAAEVLLGDLALSDFSAWTLRITGTYIVAQLVLLILNTLKTIGATFYTDIGSSELASFLGSGEHAFVKDYTTHKLRHFRQASITNTWRMTHLVKAQKCLRNIGISMAIIVLAVLWGPASGDASAIGDQAQSTTKGGEQASEPIPRSRYQMFREP